jgi:hypothetical protein
VTGTARRPGTRLLAAAVVLTALGAVVALAGDASTVLGLLALAAAGALLATTGWGRRAVAVVVLLAAVVTALDGGDAPGVVAAVLEALGALVVLTRAGALPVLGGRYEVPGEERPQRGAHGLWDALDRGEDPT